MYHNYRINASVLMENNLFREVNIESYVGGVKKVVSTKANIETFCLYDFLFFFTNSNKRKIIKEGAFEYTWINYSYIIDKNPCLFLNNAKIKRHLEILKELELIKILNDNGSIYICLINAELSMISKEAVMNHNQDPVMNHNYPPVMNHNRNNNNNINNNKNINNIKKNTKKSLREDCISLFEDSKNEIKYFNLDDWLEWVDYKLAKETKITLATFKKNLKQLVNFGENAKQSIDTSISSNWSGLFSIRTQKDIKQGVSMPKDNKSDFRGVSVRNKEECNWFLDFLKGDDKE